MSRGDAENRLHGAFCVAVAAAAGCAFWVPAWHGGELPAPLDDVYIHHDFARAAAAGHPFEWIAGQGYSSGETAPLYAAVLAVGQLVGLRGDWAGTWSAIVAVACVAAAMRAARAMVPWAPKWATWLASALVASAAVVSWSLFSGMEVALFSALAGWALVVARRACDASAGARAASQRMLGWIGALLVLTRPESVVLVAPLAVLVARHARARSAVAALARSAGPAAFVTVYFAFINRALTASPQAAGARLKLLSSNPYLSDADRAREFLMALVHLKWKVIDAGPAGWPRAWGLVALLAIAAVAAKRTRGLAVATIAAAVAWALLVSFNGAARYQNYRYYVPALLLSLFAAALGTAAIARAKSRWRFGGAALAVGAIVCGGVRWPAQIEYFRIAAKNIHEQQVAVGRKLAATTPSDAVLLVGDAGAIPYFSRRRAIDALGLGGFDRVPFAAASPHGEAAILETMQRVAPRDRPTHLALYPNWFPATTRMFGTELDRVTIVDNVICGGPTKTIYRAEWSAMRDEPAIGSASADGVDVADVESEREHGYESPAPEGGWTVADVRRAGDGRLRFDAGRVIPEGKRESFVVTMHWTVQPRFVRARIAAGSDAEIDVELVRAGRTLETLRLERGAIAEGAWEEARATLTRDVARGDRIALVARKRSHQTFHVWLGYANDEPPPPRAEQR